MSHIILLLILFFVLSPTVAAHPCDSIPQKYKLQNLNDINSLTKFMYYTETRPWYQFHCNGVTCTREEFERFCYEKRQASKKGIDPNTIMPGSMP